MVLRTASTVVFACHSKACAPPPVGTGGSSGKVSGRLLSEVRKAVAEPDGGFTLGLGGETITEGYAVALKGSDRLVAASDVGGGSFVKMLRDRAQAASLARVPRGTRPALGGWHNPDDGKVEVNVTVVFPRTQRAAAIRFAQRNDQIAIAQLHDFQIIPTGGTGGSREVE